MKEYKCKKQCGNCCKEFYLPLGKEKRDDEFNWIEVHEKCSVVYRHGIYFLKLDLKCSNLSDDGKCNIYDNRPNICREYDCRTALF